jgi:S1-C subfamily serine protease
MKRSLAFFAAAAAMPFHPLVAQDAPPLRPAAPEDEEKTTSLGRQYEGIVNIECNTLEVDYRTPWNPATPGGGSGTGFLIAENLFMTNAHVVSDASRLIIRKVGDPTPYRARVKHVAHDCDLALLELVSPAAAFSTVEPLKIADAVPKLDTTVKVVGFPIGGERISVTRGVVSRVDYQEYTHSGADQHLAIQIDAAVNPGNSGGPVLQDGMVVGVAFQGYSGDVAQNTSYMIPTPVMRRFLKDVEDGKYDRYVDLSITHFPLMNPAQRKALGLPVDGDLGVMVASVDSEGSCGGILKTGDVILEIDGHAVEANGSIDIDGEQMELAEAVERKFAGDRLSLKILRDRKEETVEITLKGASHYLMQANRYEQQPQYVMFAGLVFQPLEKPLMAAATATSLRTRYWFQYFTTDELYREKPQPVILTNVLPDEINTWLREYSGQIVEEINGVKISRLKDVADAFQKENGSEFHLIRLSGEGRPLVLSRKEAAAAQPRLLEKYGVGASAYIE